MPPILACLPALLVYNGQWPPLRDAAHAVFRQDFFVNGVFDSGLRVMVNGKMHTDGRELGFLHITTREHEDKTKRYPDADRTRRIGWIKPLIENAAKDLVGIRTWRHLEGGGEIHRYYWAMEDNFVAICSEGRRSGADRLFLVTAFSITNNPKRSDLEKKYQRRLK